MLLSEAYANACELLTNANKRFQDAEIIICNILNINKEEFILNFKTTKLNANEIKIFNYKLKELINGKPLAYILGYQDFWKTRFIVNKHVLIPRSDSETLIETILKYISLSSSLVFIDIGCGSGCLALSLLSEYKKATAFAIDITKEACNVCQENAYKLDLQNRITIINSPVEEFSTMQKFDFIISNPPYIDYKDTKIAKNVKEFEPSQALFAKDKGLYFYKQICKKGLKILKNNAYIFFEIGYNQKDEVIEIGLTHNYKYIKTIKDMQNHNRVIVLQKIDD